MSETWAVSGLCRRREAAAVRNTWTLLMVGPESRGLETPTSTWDGRGSGVVVLGGAGGVTACVRADVPLASQLVGRAVRPHPAREAASRRS